MTDKDKLSQLEADMRMIRAQLKDMAAILETVKNGDNQEPKRKPGRPRNEEKPSSSD